jgi:hypothetical protein
MCLQRAPEKYIAGAALDRAGLDNVGILISNKLIGLQGLLEGKLLWSTVLLFAVCSSGYNAKFQGGV